jgi:hypothetical protein
VGGTITTGQFAWRATCWLTEVRGDTRELGEDV